MSTIKDVATAAGVSVATVSRAFDENAALVSEKTRARIYACAEALQYRPNLLARGLKRARTGMVGFIVPSLENTFYHEVLRHVEAALRTEGFRLLVSFLNNPNEYATALSDMEASRVDAVLLCALDRREEETLSRVSKAVRVIQLFNAAFPEYDSLIMDDVGGAELATRHLLEKGHRRIFYLGDGARISGYFRAYEAAGLLPPEPGLQLPSFNVSEESILSALRKSGATAALGISRQGYHLLRAARTGHLKIPRDLSVVVYDDSEWAEMMGISAICHPQRELARRIVAHIAALLHTPDAFSGQWHEVLSPYLTERGSVLDIRQ